MLFAKDHQPPTPYQDRNVVLIMRFDICIIHWNSLHLGWTMMTSSHRNSFRITGHLCGEFTGHCRARIREEASLQWRHNWRDRVSNRQPPDCLLNRLFRRRSKKESKLCVAGLCGGNSPVSGEFSEQRTSNGESVTIWWCHHCWLHFGPKYLVATSRWAISCHSGTWNKVIAMPLLLL